MNRKSGILMHLSSLPGPYGIGTMGKEAYAFVDFLKKAGQSYWQILPLGQTGYGDSPYQSFSTFAGNPYLIDLDTLIKEGSLTKEECENIAWSEDNTKVEYALLFEHRYGVLRKAYLRDKDRKTHALRAFREENAHWLENYALYMALKFEANQLPWQQWETPIKCREKNAMAEAKIRLEEEIGFWIYVQYQFFTQWNALKTYANERGISMVGDLPIYVAEDSADVWANHEIFQLDEDRLPIRVAGCPPDYFAQKGQLWGNPLYDWDALKETGYAWWIARMKSALSLYDMVRIDHFRGFSAYYAIPYGREDAVVGQWLPGPGMDLFNALKDALGENLPIIAEDLGLMDDGVRKLLKDTEFPGMKVVQFGLNPGENSEYLPHNYPKNAVAYIGTHDNDTLRGWFAKETESVQEFALSYMRTHDLDYHWGFIETLMASPADTVIFTLQDVLGLDGTARMNTPSTLGGNWTWRLDDMGRLKDTVATRLNTLCKVYSRG